jgi:hypothetical protein
VDATIFSSRQPAACKKRYFPKNYLTANICQNYLTLYNILKRLPSSFICGIAIQNPSIIKKVVLINFRISSPSKQSRQSVDAKIDLFSICLHCKAWMRGSRHYFFVYFSSTTHASKHRSHAIWTVENELVVLSRRHRCRLDRICGVSQCEKCSSRIPVTPCRFPRCPPLWTTTTGTELTQRASSKT